MAAHGKQHMPQAQFMLPPCSEELLQSQLIVHDPNLGSRGGVRGGRTCTSAHADTRMLDATRSQGITSYTLWGSWHVKRAIPAQVHRSLAILHVGSNEEAQALK